MAKDKIYCGNGKKIEGEYGVFRSASICLDKIPEEHITKGKDGKRYVNITISDYDKPNEWGNDVSITVNTYKAKPKEPDMSVPSDVPKYAENNPPSSGIDDGLPF